MSDDFPDVSSPQRPSDEAVSKTSLSEDGTMEETGTTCQNCGAPLAGEYCHDCGQRHVPQLRLWDLGRRFLETILDIDDLGAGLRRTLVEGMRSPGSLPRQYVDGKRKRLVNPIGYFLIASTLAFLVLSFFQAEWIQAMAEMYRAQWAAMGTSPSEVFAEGSVLRTQFGWTSVDDVARGVFAVLKQVQSYFKLATGLIVAGVLRVLFSETSYADLVVFEFYTIGQATLLMVVVVPLLVRWHTTAAIAANPLLMLCLHALAGPGFFGRTWKAWLLPPLAFIAGQILLMVGSGIAGFVGATVFLNV